METTTTLGAKGTAVGVAPAVSGIEPQELVGIIFSDQPLESLAEVLLEERIAPTTYDEVEKVLEFIIGLPTTEQVEFLEALLLDRVVSEETFLAFQQALLTGDAPQSDSQITTTAPAPGDLKSIVREAYKLVREYGLANIPQVQIAIIDEAIRTVDHQEVAGLIFSLEQAVLLDVEQATGADVDGLLDVAEIIVGKAKAQTIRSIRYLYNLLHQQTGFRVPVRDGSGRPLATIYNLKQISVRSDFWYGQKFQDLQSSTGDFAELKTFKVSLDNLDRALARMIGKREPEIAGEVQSRIDNRNGLWSLERSKRILETITLGVAESVPVLIQDMVADLEAIRLAKLQELRMQLQAAGSEHYSAAERVFLSLSYLARSIRSIEAEVAELRVIQTILDDEAPATACLDREEIANDATERLLRVLEFEHKLLVDIVDERQDELRGNSELTTKLRKRYSEEITDAKFKLNKLDLQLDALRHGSILEEEFDV